MSTMSVAMKAAYKKALGKDTRLRADDSGYGGQVALELAHGEGFFYWKGAFWEFMYCQEYRWVVVYTEHQGFHLFLDEDVAIIYDGLTEITKILKAIKKTLKR